jgi:hypothetical protein
LSSCKWLSRVCMRQALLLVERRRRIRLIETLHQQRQLVHRHPDAARDDQKRRSVSVAVRAVTQEAQRTLRKPSASARTAMLKLRAMRDGCRRVRLLRGFLYEVKGKPRFSEWMWGGHEGPRHVSLRVTDDLGSFGGIHTRIECRRLSPAAAAKQPFARRQQRSWNFLSSDAYCHLGFLERSHDVALLAG